METTKSTYQKARCKSRESTNRFSGSRKISFRAEAVFQSAVQESDNAELLRLLESPEGRSLDLDQTNHSGLTALHQTVLNNNLNGVKLMLCNNVSVNIKDIHGFSPLHTAAACDLLQVASLLIIFGADLFSLNNDGDLPVDLAKDAQVINVLTVEMMRLIHQKTYMKSVLLFYMSESLHWLFVSMLYVIVLVFRCLQVLFVKLFDKCIGNVNNCDKGDNVVKETKAETSEKDPPERLKIS